MSSAQRIDDDRKSNGKIKQPTKKTMEEKEEMVAKVEAIDGDGEKFNWN